MDLKKLEKRKTKYHEKPDGRCIKCWYVVMNCACPIERSCRRCNQMFHVTKKTWDRDYFCHECVEYWSQHSPFAQVFNH